MNPFTGLSLESSCFNHLHKRIYGWVEEQCWLVIGSMLPNFTTRNIRNKINFTLALYRYFYWCLRLLACTGSDNGSTCYEYPILFIMRYVPDTDTGTKIKLNKLKGIPSIEYPRTLPWRITKVNMAATDNLIQFNLGPQHPSTHGVLRIVAWVDCETIKWLEPEVGLLHRGTEKLIETCSYNKSIP